MLFNNNLRVFVFDVIVCFHFFPIHGYRNSRNGNANCLSSTPFFLAVMFFR